MQKMDGNEFVLGNLGKVIYIGDEGDVCYVFYWRFDDFM